MEYTDYKEFDKAHDKWHANGTTLFLIVIFQLTYGLSFMAMGYLIMLKILNITAFTTVLIQSFDLFVMHPTFDYKKD